MPQLPKGFGQSVVARANRNMSKKETYPYRGAFMGRVESPAADEQVTFDTSIGRRVSSFAYPFVSTNAWVRGQPESGSTMIAIIGSDTQELQPIGYFDPAKSNAAIRYRDLTETIRSNLATPVPTMLPYRVLTPGDIDVASNYAQAFFGLKDVAQFRGGISHLTLTSKKSSVETPLFEVLGPDHTASRILNDEFRFGVVRRVTSAKGTATTPVLIRGTVPSAQDATKMAFAKEHTVIVTGSSIVMGGKLIDHRQGNVVNDDGTLARSSTTQQELRARLQWYSNTSNTKVEIDQSGNWEVVTSADGVSGGVINIPSGSLRVSIGQAATLQSNRDFRIDSSLGTFTATGTAGFLLFTPARGEVAGNLALLLRSNGGVDINTPLYQGVRVGGGVVPQHPALVANPAYITTLNDVLAKHLALSGAIKAYGTSAAAAWAAVGAILAVIDPSGTVVGLCSSAAGAAGSLIAASASLDAAIAAHLPTLGTNPTGFQSVKLKAE